MHFEACGILHITKQFTRRHTYTKDHRISTRPEGNHITTRSEVWISQDTYSNIK